MSTRKKPAAPPPSPPPSVTAEWPFRSLNADPETAEAPPCVDMAIQRDAVRAWARRALERSPELVPVTIAVGPVQVTASRWDGGTTISVSSVQVGPSSVWSTEAMAGAGMLLLAAADFCLEQDEG